MIVYVVRVCVFFFKQKTAYEMRISDWSSDVCSSDLSTARSTSTPAETRRPPNTICLDPALAAEGAAEFGGMDLGFDIGGGLFGLCLVILVRGMDEIGRASCRERVCEYV